MLITAIQEAIEFSEGDKLLNKSLAEFGIFVLQNCHEIIHYGEAHLKTNYFLYVIKQV